MGSNQSDESKRVVCSSVSDFVASLKRNGSAYENIVLANMEFKKKIKNLPVLPGVTQISFIDSIIKNYDILGFNQWCPNVTELAFVRTHISQSVFHHFISEDELPAVKTFTYSFESTMEMFGYFIEEMDVKLPSLESLTLILNTSDDLENFEPMWDDEAPYESTYFENLTKLSLTAFGDEGDRVFDYMNISNEKLEELEFKGFWLTKDNLKWIKNCKQLSKLTLGCKCLEGKDLMKNLKGMEKLKEVHLDIGSIDWTPMKMIEFFRNNKQLKMISIECERNNKEFKFDDEFKKMFDELAQQRDEMLIEVTFGKDDGMRQLKISKESFEEKEPLVELESDDDSDEDYEEFYSYSEDDSTSSDDDETDSSNEEEENQ